MPYPKRNTANRRRKPRDVAESIIHDKLVEIEGRSKRGPLTEEESGFVLSAYKLFGEADQIDAEVAYLEHLSPEQSNRLDDLLAELEEETRPSEN